MSWNISYSDKGGVKSPLYPATVPGCVQFDMEKALGIPSIMTGDHEDEYRWMEDKFWHYCSEIYIEDNGKTPYLLLSGVDYEYDLLINENFILHHEGMFTTTETALDEYIGEKIKIEIVIYPAPKVKGVIPIRGTANESSASCKPAFSYSWDWCPRFVTLGISDDVIIEYRPEVFIKDLQVSYKLSEDYKKAKIFVECCRCGEGRLTYSLYDYNNDEILKGEIEGNSNSFALELDDPKLWWPHDYGDQPIYRLKLQITSSVGDEYSLERKLGFRRVKLVPNAGTWDDPSTPIKTCSKPPMTLEINGKRIFVKGSNWVPSELCRASVTEERTREQLQLLKDLNMHAVRLWGGGYIQPEFFYDICDEYGILFWQEFPLACACYSDDEHYLSVLEKESEAIIKQLRTHPALMLWCGGNELFNQWSKMTPQSKALRVLDKQTAIFDFDTPYLMTSPQYGVGHGYYDMIMPNGNEHLSEFRGSDYTAYVEFGCGCPSEWDYLSTFMTEEEIKDFPNAPIWVKRHAVAIPNQVRGWFDCKSIKKLSGCRDDLREIITAGNEIQTIMYSNMFEEVRRKWPKTSMVMNWCFNEPWPTAAGNALLNYPALPRPSYYGVKAALKACKLSIAFDKISWRSGEVMQCELWVLNDSFDEIPSGKAMVYAEYDEEKVFLGSFEYPSVGEHTNTKINVFQVTPIKTKTGRFVLSVVDSNNQKLNSEYQLFIK